MIDGVKKWLKGCTLLKNGAINIDMLGDKPVKYSIETGVYIPIIKKYDDGGSLRQFVFYFCSRESIDETGLKNLENAEFYERLNDWVEEQNAKENFPNMGNGKSAQRVEVLTPGFLMDETGTTGKYQVQMRVIYYKGVI